MRLHQKLAAVVCGLVMLGSARTARPQDFSESPFRSGGPAWMAAPGLLGAGSGHAAGGIRPISYDDEPETGGAPPRYSVRLEHEGAPPPPGPAGPLPAPPAPVYPYPEISPFEHRFSQHRVEDGLWTHEVNDGPREYFFNVAFLRSRLRFPEERIFGSKAVAVPPLEGLPVRVGAEMTFPVEDHIFEKHFKTEGILLRGGWWNPDDTGLELTGWWASDITEEFKRGQDIDPTEIIPFIPPLVVPMDDGTAFGTVRSFTQLFQLTYTSEAANANIDFMYSPWWKASAIKVRPLWGFRYTYVKERLQFRGVSPFVPPTLLDNEAQNHLAGPEIGLQAEVGGNAFRIVGSGRFILFVNTEKMDLSGENFGQQFAVLLAQESTRFTQKSETHHVSPAVELAIRAEADIFGFIPLLNKWKLLENAKLNVAFRFLEIAEVGRPASSIVYRGLPLLPELKPDRSKWHTTAWDFGIVWQW